MKLRGKKTKILLAAAAVILLSVAGWVLIPKAGLLETAKVPVLPGRNMLSTEYAYSIVEKGAKYQNVAEIQETADGFRFISTEKRGKEKDIVVEAMLNKDYETTGWNMGNPAKNIKVSAVRKRDRIILTGTFDNKQNNRKEMVIDGRKWLQVYQLGLKRFAVASKKEAVLEFWCLNPDDPGNAMVLFAEKIGADTITLNGARMDTARLRIGLTGLLSIFWGGNYWFSVPEGNFVKAKISGDVLVELKGEKAKESGTAGPALNGAKK